MADIHFSCPACQQHLVADEGCAGLAIDCPHCNKSIQVPFPAKEDVTATRTRKSLSKWINRATALEADLSEMRKKLAETERQLSEQRIQMAENVQRLRVANAENQCLGPEIEEEKTRRETAEQELFVLRQSLAALQHRIAELEAGQQHLQLTLGQTELELSHAHQRLNLANGERSELITDSEETKRALVEALTQLDAARKEKQELNSTLQRTQAKLERMENRTLELESDSQKASGELSSASTELRRVQRALQKITVERDKLQADIKRNHKLSDLLTVKAERDRMEKELRETQVAVSDMREKLDHFHAEREALKKEKTELNLKIAAMRDSHSDTQLQEDNEVLRRLVERLNEELKELGPATKKRRRGDSGNRLGDLMRSVAQRCFVSDPDVT